MENNFCEFPYGFKHRGARLHCQVSMATNQLFRLDSSTPHREDLEALTQWNTLSVCQPPLLNVWYDRVCDRTVKPYLHMAWQENIHMYSHMNQW